MKLESYSSVLSSLWHPRFIHMSRLLCQNEKIEILTMTCDEQFVKWEFVVKARNNNSTIESKNFTFSSLYQLVSLYVHIPA
jgi:hypothetical protein